MSAAMASIRSSAALSKLMAQNRLMRACCLCRSSVGFLPPTDPRIVGTIHAIEKHLLVDGFVMRYHTGEGVDGLPPGEGAFLACSFWLADNYVLQGRIAEARDLFERLLSLRNDVGLLAEEYAPSLGRQLGISLRRFRMWP